MNRTVRLTGMIIGMLALTTALASGAFGAGLPGSTAESLVAAAPWKVWIVAPLGSVLALIFAFIFYKNVMKASEGDAKMKEIAAHVTEGAMAYLKRQYKVVAIVFLVLFITFGVMAWRGLLPPLVPVAFLTGGFFSGLCGYLGMKTATAASSRTAQGAKESLNRGLQVAFRSGAVMGLVVVGFGLLDICLWFIALYYLGHKNVAGWLEEPMSLVDITVTMLSFGIGASTQALFARVGGGIFTKAADVGADLVGKVEAGIPEDDPRNPATIADNVGDNVGDVAGMGADLYESYCGSILATAALGVAAATAAVAGSGLTGDAATSIQLRFLFLPMVLAGVGIVLSIIGVYVVRSGEEATQKVLLKALGRGVNLSSVLIFILSLGACWLMFGDVGKEFLPGGFSAIGVWGSIVTGLVAGMIIGKGTEYYTSEEYSPTKNIANQAKTGPATVIIDGIATGMLSTWLPVVTIVAAIFLSYLFAGGFTTTGAGLYGIGIAAVGMLSTLGITLATDAYGPIADNAGGNAEMSGQEPFVRERTDALDALGNTTAATGKGFAIGSAALTALALIAAFIEEVRHGLKLLGQNEIVLTLADGSKHAVQVATASFADFMAYYEVNLMNPKVLMGMMLGSMLAFVFCAFTMKAVGRAAGAMVDEVRRQFREIAGIMEGTGKPDYASCVSISTKGAQRAMIVPSLMAIIVPVLTGVLLGVAGVVGLLASGLATGFVLAVMMANAGGAWDNAKKYIEKGNLGGKGSDAHKAAVVGDTVGDPFKDTSGPSLNILIKLMSMVSVVFAGLTVAVDQWLRTR